MEIKAELQKPFTVQERTEFIVHQNHQLGYEIRETETALQAWGYTEEEKEEQRKEAIKKLSLTRGDVFRGLLMAKGVTRTMLRSIIENLPDETNEQSITKEMALIDFDEALNFYRGVALIDTVGEQLDITPEQMDKFFQTNDWHELVPEPEPEEEEEDESNESNADDSAVSEEETQASTNDI